MDKNKFYKPYDGDEGYIYVSYCHDDEKLVLDILSDLHRRGYRMWYDNGIPMSAGFVENLAQKIKNCKVFLCFLSPAYIDSAFCQRELLFALSNHKRVIPIKTESFDLPDTLKFQLSGIPWTNLTKFSSSKEMIDHLSKIASEILSPCRQAETVAEAETPPVAEEEYLPNRDKRGVNKKIQLLKTVSLAFLLAGLIILLIAAYYLVVKAGIPYQDPPPELQIRYAVNMGIGDELFRDGLIVTAIGLLGRILSRFLNKKDN